MVGTGDTDVLRTMTSDLSACLHGNHILTLPLSFFPPDFQAWFWFGSGLVLVWVVKVLFASACAAEPSCHHVALFDRRTRCDLYSSLNVVCSASQQVSRLRVKGQPIRAQMLLQLCVCLQARGFLGNPRAERFHKLRCSLSVRGGASDLLVLRKNGEQLTVTMTTRTTKYLLWR